MQGSLKSSGVRRMVINPADVPLTDKDKKITHSTENMLLSHGSNLAVIFATKPLSRPKNIYSNQMIMK
jgi:hypothetical protein